MPLEIIDHADLSTRLSLRLKSRVDRLIRVHHPLELVEAKQAVLGRFRGLLGEGSNSVFGSHIRGSLVQIAWRGIEQRSAGQVRAQAGEHWDELVQWSLCQNLQGLENLSMIPGSVGAAPVQNIGAYGVELCQHLIGLEAIHWQSLERRYFSNEDCRFAYRDSVFKRTSHQDWIISQVDLNLRPVSELHAAQALNYTYADLKRRFSEAPPQSALELAQAIRAIRSEKLPDPAIEPNAGSFFHNPRIKSDQANALKQQFPALPVQASDHGYCKVSAAWMIDHCGLKGFRSGDVGVSKQHALVLVNYGEGTGEALIALAQFITDKVEARFGLRLQIEPRVLMH